MITEHKLSDTNTTPWVILTFQHQSKGKFVKSQHTLSLFTFSLSQTSNIVLSLLSHSQPSSTTTVLPNHRPCRLPLSSSSPSSLSLQSVHHDQRLHVWNPFTHFSLTLSEILSNHAEKTESISVKNSDKKIESRSILTASYPLRTHRKIGQIKENMTPMTTSVVSKRSDDASCKWENRWGILLFTKRRMAFFTKRKIERRMAGERWCFFLLQCKKGRDGVEGEKSKGNKNKNKWKKCIKLQCYMVFVLCLVLLCSFINSLFLKNHIISTKKNIIKIC